MLMISDAVKSLSSLFFRTMLNLTSAISIPQSKIFCHFLIPSLDNLSGDSKTSKEAFGISPLSADLMKEPNPALSSKLARLKPLAASVNTSLAMIYSG